MKTTSDEMYSPWSLINTNGITRYSSIRSRSKMLKSTDLELALTTLRTVTLVHKRCLSFPATEARYKYPMNNLDSVRHTHNPKKNKD